MTVSQDPIAASLPSLLASAPPIPGSPASVQNCSAPIPPLAALLLAKPPTVNPHSYVESFSIKIGGETVKELSNAEFPACFKTFNVKWDTTNFAHGTSKSIEVALKLHLERWLPDATDTNGNIELAHMDTATVEVPMTSVSVSIYNYAGIAEIEEFSGQTGGYIYGKLFGTNHERDQQIDVLKPAFVTMLQKSTFLYFSGHGVITPLLSGFGSDDPLWAMTQSEVLSNRTNAVNTLKYPKMNFVFLDCCDLGQVTGWDTAFLYPSTNNIINQSLVGWKVVVDQSWSAIFAPKLAEGLAQKKTVQDAMIFAFEELKGNATNIPTTADWEDYLDIKGDPLTRITGLYNGTVGPAPSSWFLVTE